ncbi:ATP-binding protein [Streptacidiphilus fuscans]|uniref:Tetratricopeptide repeat protein n=1 Tax=Streptacidiphilus fuscans TaxID=2789292 RepID=A0A931B959_9ACTN|nr:tetratricopeptide repeat protein [Streptacidiphilus fuscans]MBF9072819.1 tetratricopeptide repeat protein [Streptacidiphilus fuscans]
MGEQRGVLPDPGRAEDLAEFIGLLGELRTWAGMPSYRVLAKGVGPLLRPPRVVSATTVADVFKVGRRRLDLDLVVAVVRALGVDESALDRWRQACVTVHAQAKTGGPVGVLGQLPTELATFTGRRDELTRLIAQATNPRNGDGSGPNTVVISAVEGMAGVGKTQLAVHAAHRLVRDGHFSDVQLHVNLRGFDPELPPADPSAVLEAFLRQLGVPAQQIPACREERAATFRDRLRDRSALVLLDNAADEDQVRDLIPAGPACLVLITSRRSLIGLDGVTPHLLDTFTDAESLELLGRIAGRDRVAAEPEAAARIVEHCDGLPLAVALTAARLRSRPAWSLADLACRLEAGRLEALRAGSRALTPVLELSYRDLTEPLQRVFRLLGHHPGPDFTPAMAAALADIPAHQAEDALDQLHDENLIRQNTPGRYELHDLLRAYAAELAEAEPDPDPVAPLARLLDYFETTARRADELLTHHKMPLPPASGSRPDVGLPDRSAALAWMRTERENLIATAGQAQQTHPSRCLALAQVMGTFLQLDGPWLRASAFQGDMLALARRCGDGLALANTLWNLGRLGLTTGQYHQAAGHLAEAVDAYRSLGQDLGEANALWDLGRARQFTGALHQVGELYERALTLYQGLGEHASEANVHHELARVRHLTGDDDAAVALEGQALEGFRRALNRLGEANALIGLARIHQATGRLDLAADLFGQANDVYRELGSRLGQANALTGTARIHHIQGRLHTAKELYEAALVEYRDIGGRQGEANTLHDLGRAEQDLGHPDTAADLYRQAEELFTALDDPHGTAQVLNSTGTLHTVMGNPHEALPLHRRALDLARATNTPTEEAKAHEGITRALTARLVTSVPRKRRW